MVVFLQPSQGSASSASSQTHSHSHDHGSTHSHGHSHDHQHQPHQRHHHHHHEHSSSAGQDLTTPAPGYTAQQWSTMTDRQRLVVQHGHDHSAMEHVGKWSPCKFAERDMPDFSNRNWNERAFTIGIGGPVGSGKTALTLALCKAFRDSHNIGVVTNDIFTKEDQEFLIKNQALADKGRIRAVETGGCPHAAIREDISANLGVLEQLQADYDCEMLIDVSGGDKIPRKGGPGISQSDLLVVNKIDIAEYVGASLEVMKRDADKMRDGGPTLFTSVKHGQGVEAVVEMIMSAWVGATGGRRV
ncbi:hypothetical protein OIO90_006181 [Microbotryomycetes sp. JL221]|nr:hypothetical protein OIO90_006181 [Microbotryomycetes sp. JL221]